jgi:Cu(I)/Ag(I) efflux system membrane fusion protein
MKLFKTLLVLALLAGTFVGGYVVRASRHPDQPGRRVLYWVDPMHPQYKSDKPGIAPDCGMQLEPVYADEVPQGAAAQAARRRILYYRDPRDPKYTADKPGLNPETGNTLEPVYASEPQQGAAPASALASGTIRVSSERQQVIGVKFATVEAGGASRTIRTVGKVAVDETRVGHVHTRIEGWIENVFVDFTGDIVRKGQPMLTIYSPEMLASEEELLLAARAKEVMPSLLNAAKRRLQLWQLSDADIEQVLRTGEPIRSITVHAPMSGFITERNAFPNQKVTPDSDLYTITDLTRVWIMADVFESDITSIKPGDPARVVFENGGAPPITARVDYMQPQVDPTTRTLKVRLDASNPGTRMKPEMFVNVEFGIATTPQLTVPAEAVLDTGERQTVFVDLGGGYLEPRAVVVGERFGDRVSVTRGLSVGERVVASGVFLIDSESQLKAAAGGMGAPSAPRTPARSAAPPATPASPSHRHPGNGRD